MFLDAFLSSSTSDTNLSRAIYRGGWEGLIILRDDGVIWVD
jgi:hypothetical protein